MIIKLRTISSNFQNEKFLLFTIFLVGTLFIYIYIWVDERPLPLSLAFIATLMFCFPVGYATLLPIKNSIRGVPIFIKLIIFLGVGYAFNFLWSFFLSPVTVTPLSSFSLVIISSAIILYSVYINKKDKERLKNENIERRIRQAYSQIKSINTSNISYDTLKNQNILLFSVFIILLIYILWQIQIYEWPPYGDSQIHAFLTTIQISEGSILDHIPSHPEINLDYPLGMHFFVANQSILYNINPPQTFWIFGGLSMLLLLSSVLAITFTLTKSLLLSIIVLLSSFYVHLSGQPIMHIWHHFLIIGSFPNLTGFFFIFLLILILLVIRNQVKLPHILFLILFALSGVIMYPTVIVYSIFILSVFVATSLKIKDFKNIMKRTKSKLFDKNEKSWLDFQFHYIIIIVLGISMGKIIEHVRYILVQKFSLKVFSETGDIYSGYGIFNYLVDSVFIFSVFGSIIASIYIIIYHKQDRFIGFIIIGFFLILIHGDQYDDLKILFSTVRYSAITMIFSWIGFSVLISSFWKFPTRNKNSADYFGKLNHIFTQNRNLHKKLIIISFGLLTVILVGENNLAMGLTLLDLHQRTNLHSLPYYIPESYAQLKPHLEGIYWITKNVDEEDLILDYYPKGTNLDLHPYHWISTIKYKNQINGLSGVRFLDFNEKQEINNSFSNFFSYNGTLQNTLEKYDIRYIISEPEERRDSVLKKYDFLDVVFQNNYDIIYKVAEDNPFSVVEHIEETIIKAEKMEGIDPKTTIILYNDILHLDFFEVRAWEGKIRVLIETNQYEEALAVSDGMIEKFDDLRKSQRGDTEEFSHLYQKVLNIRDITIKQIAEDISQRLDEAKKLEKTDPYSAIMIYNDIINLDSLEIRAWQGKIRVLIETNRYEEALSAFDNIIEKFDSLRNSQLRGTEKYETFFRYYQEALKSKAILEENIEDYKDALRSYNKLLDDDKFNISVLKNKARILEKMEEFRQSLEVYRFINALEPNNIVTQQHLEDLIKRLSKDE